MLIKSLEVTIFTPSNRLQTSIKYQTRVPNIITNVATQLGISEKAIHTQLYDPSYDTDTDLDTASGKVLLTYNPDIFTGGSTVSAYQVWARALLVKDTFVLNSQINTPLMDMSVSPIFP